jgi:DNA polymerase III alpha subunit
MKTDQYGRNIYSESDICDLLLTDPDIINSKCFFVDNSVDTSKFQLSGIDTFNVQSAPSLSISLEEFDKQQQNSWFMPMEYHKLDIAKYILDLCTTQEQLQRCGQELLLYQKHNLFDLLRFLKYLVDIIDQNQIVSGIGRGSSVASYVLYLLGVHRIDSLYYELDIKEFFKS